jgi:hypothetical protein
LGQILENGPEFTVASLGLVIQNLDDLGGGRFSFPQSTRRDALLGNSYSSLFSFNIMTSRVWFSKLNVGIRFMLSAKLFLQLLAPAAYVFERP